MLWWLWLLIVLAVYCLVTAILCWRFPENHIDWERVNLEELSFPSDFSWGVATASHQIEGHNQNNWSKFESERGIEASGAACEHWNRWKTDFDLVEALGVGHYRF